MENDVDDFDLKLLEKLNSIQNLLIEKDRPFLNLEETSQYLGISKNTLYGYTSKGILPFYKVQGRRIYFKIDDLNDFVMNDKNSSNSFISFSLRLFFLNFL